MSGRAETAVIDYPGHGLHRRTVEIVERHDNVTFRGFAMGPMVDVRVGDIVYQLPAHRVRAVATDEAAA